MYQREAQKVASLVEEKQQAYGDSFGKSGDVLALLYPNGIAPHQYDDMLAVVRIIDKLFRIANEPDYNGESPWQDINGYALLALCRNMKSTPPRDAFYYGDAVLTNVMSR